jgi:hypothetical protein
LVYDRCEMIQRKNYSSKFTNKYGEEWHFEYDPATGEGILKGSDADWQPYRVVNGGAIGLLLSDEELIWLRKAWASATVK